LHRSFGCEPTTLAGGAMSLSELYAVTLDQRYRSLFEESRDAVYITARDGRFLDVNRSFLEMFGYSREQLLRGNAAELYADAADRHRFQNEIEATGSVREYEVRFRRRDGSVMHALLSAAAYRDSAGQVLWYQGIIHDFSARKEAEDALARSEHFARTIVSSVGEGVIVYDRELRYQVWNRFMEELTGIKAEHLLGKDALEAFPHLKEYGLDTLLERALGGERVRSEDTPYRVPETGRDGWVTAFYAPQVAPNGEIIGVVAIIHDVTERKRAEERLLHNAFHDSLTGLPNRSLFLDRLERLIKHAQRHPEYMFAVLFLDLDRFKVINDSLGHSIGDELLIAIGHRLEACLREGDSVARLGGDEFAVLLDDVRDGAEAIRVADRIERELGTPFFLRGQEVFTSTSIGIALSAASYTKPGELLRDADTAMYRAKSGGRGRYEVFDREMHLEAVEQLKIETDLRRAVDRRELRLHYQPIIALESGELVGFEALLRWQHPRHGVLQPADFIPLAEETGMIVPIGWWVLREACVQMREWITSYPLHEGLTVSVNLSARQFTQSDLVDQIDRILAETKCPARALKLEITESVIMRDAKEAAAMLNALKQRGIGLCIDDFGTGYSSLSYLNSFPIDTLKIDRSFVSQVDHDGSTVELIETIVALSRVLGMSAIAEGVETPEQLELVRRLGSQYAQGFYFSVPLDIKQAEALLVENLVW
jgi:diguanylate cyclase (GGDEF)-like protein/PAS domain S-box-containing protein